MLRQNRQPLQLTIVSLRSRTTLLPLLQPASNMGFSSSRADCLRQNDYLYDLLSFGEDCSLSDFFNTGACFREAEKGDFTSTKALASILHQQNLLAHSNGSETLSAHRKELTLRLFSHFYQGRHEIDLSNINPKLSECLSFIPFDQKYKMRFRDTDLLDDNDTFAALSWQFANLTLSVFRQLCEEFHPHSLVHSAFAQTTGHPLYMEVAGYVTSKALASPDTATSTKATMQSVLLCIDQSLSQEMSSWEDTLAQARPSLMFYLAASYLHQLLTHSTADFASLRATILRYRKRTIDLGKVDDVIEKRLLADYFKRPRHYESCPFTPEWWAAFDFDNTESI